MSRKRRRRQIARGWGSVRARPCLMGGTAQAAVFTVDSLQDVPDPAPAALSATKKKCKKKKKHKRSAESAKKKHKKCKGKKKKQ